MASISTLVDEYLDRLSADGKYSSSTLKSYTHSLNIFLSFIKEGFEVDDITPELITSFKKHIAHVSEGQNLFKKSTQNLMLVSLRSFLLFLKEKGFIVLDPDVISLDYQKREMPEVVDEASILRLCSAPDQTTIEGLRDTAILAVFLSTGLLVSELSKLNVSDLDFDHNKLVVAKNGKQREFLLTDETCNSLKSYLSRRNDSFTPLFIRLKGSVNSENSGEKMRLSDRSIERMVEKYSKEVGLKTKITPQLLRYHFAAALLEEGKDLKEAQKILGHQSLVSTKSYSKLADPT